MNNGDVKKDIWLALSFPIGVLLMISAGGGFFVNGIYRDNPNFAVQAVGQDIISLFVVLPILIISTILVYRGSHRARLVWLGVLVYLVYTYIIAAFTVKYNSLFLVYVALLGCSLYSLIGSLVTMDMSEIASSFSEKTPVKTISIDDQLCLSNLVYERLKPTILNKKL